MAEPASTLTAYDPKTGAPVEVEAGSVGAAFASGQITFAADQRVPIRAADGTIREVSGAEAAAYFGGEGMYAGAVSQGQLQRQRDEEAYGGAGGVALAGLAGLARGATAGLSDVALAGLGGEGVRQDLQKLQEVNAISSGVGEGLGVLAPILASGGGAAVARGGLGAVGRGAVTGLEVLSAPTRAIGAVGRAVEGGVGAALGEGGLARLVASGASAGAEGALFGVGQAISQSTLQNTDLTAERIVAAMGHGALLGAGTGAGLSALGTAMRAGASRAGELGASALSRVEAGEGRLLARLEEREAGLAGELAGATPRSEVSARSLVDRFGKEQAIKSTGATQGMVERLQKMGPGSEERVVRKLLDDAPEAIGKAPGSLLSAAEKAKAAEVMVQRDGEKIGSMLDDLSAAGEKADVRGVVDRFRAKEVQPLHGLASPDAAKAAKEIDGWLTGLEKTLDDGDVKKLWEARRDLRKDINWKNEAGSGDRYNDLKRQLYRDLGDEIQRVGESASEKVGAGFAARWRNANQEYRAATWLSEATERGAANATSRRSFGLSEQLGAVAGFASGGLASIPMALGGAAIQNLVRRYGNDVAAQLARAATKQDFVKAIDGAVERMAGEKVAAILGGVRAGIKDARPGAPLADVIERTVEREGKNRAARADADFEAQRARLQTFRAAAPARLAASTAALADVPPVQRAVQASVMRGADFLDSKLPRRPAAATLVPGVEPEVSAPEKAKFLRYARAVNDPLSVLEDAKKGLPSREGVEALRTVYPALYGALQDTIRQQIVEHGGEMDRNARVALTALTGIPADRSLQPKNMAAVNAAYAQMTTSKPQNAAPVPQKTPDLAGAYAPRSSTLEAR